MKFKKWLLIFYLQRVFIPSKNLYLLTLNL
jgi:hypothetical protein